MPKRPPKVARELVIPPELAGREPDGSTFCETERGALRWCDVFDLLGGLDSGSADLVVADPPYAIAKESWDVFESPQAYLDWCDRWLAEVARVLSPTGSAYVCGFSEILADIKARSTAHFPGGCRWLVWFYRNKANLGSDWGRSHESVLHLRMGRKLKLNVDPLRIPYNNHTTRYPERVQAVSSQYGKGVRRDKWEPHPLGAKPRDVLEIPVLCNGTAEKTDHPTQKPEELIRRFVEGTTSPGQLVVDPFAGSGTTCVVAERHGRRWICGERDARYLGLARERIEAAIASR